MESDALLNYLRWIESEAPQIHGALVAPLDASSLLQIEVAYGRRLPPSLVEMYSLVGGQAHWAEPLLPDPLGGPNSFTLMTPEEGFAAWKDRVAFARDVPATGQVKYENSPGVRAAYWCRGWTPFASDGGTGLLCVDDEPLGDGLGQVIAYWDDVPIRKLVSPSLSELLALTLKAVRSGAAKYVSGQGVFYGFA